MTEKILRIEEVNFKEKPDSWSSYSGYQVITDKRTIKIGVQEGQSCCESTGHFITNDDASEFVGSFCFLLIK